MLTALSQSLVWCGSQHFSDSLFSREILTSLLYVQVVEQNMLDKLVELRKVVTIGIVGGSDLPKQFEQLGETGVAQLL